MEDLKTTMRYILYINSSMWVDLTMTMIFDSLCDNKMSLSILRSRLYGMMFIGALCVISLCVISGCTPQNTVKSRPPAVPKDSIHILVEKLIKPQIRLIEKTPSDPDLHGTLGLMYEANDVWGPAVEAFDNACALDPNNATWQIHLNRCKTSFGDSTNERARLEAIAGRYPGHAGFNFMLGTLRLEDGDLPSAESMLLRSLQLQPDEPSTLLALSRLCLMKGQSDQSLSYADQAKRKAAGQPAVYQARGLALQALKRFEEAQPDLERGQGAPQLSFPDPGMSRLAAYYATPQKMINLGSDLLQVGQHNRAEQLMNKVLSFDENNKDALNTLAIALQRQNRGLEGLDKLIKASQADPNYFPTQINLAVAYLDLNKPAEGIRPARKAVQIAPENATAHRLLGMCFIKTRDFNGALRSFEQSLKLRPDDFECHAPASEAALFLNNNERALYHLEKASALRPNYLPTQVNTAHLYIKLRKFKEAEVLVKDLLARSGEHPKVIALYQSLQNSMKTEGKSP